MIEVRNSFDRVSKFGDAVPLRFYSKLFLAHRELREKFEIDMSEQREKLWSMLDSIVHGETDELEELGRRHEMYTVLPEHYPLVGGALIATLRHFDEEWDSELEELWSNAYQTVSDIMTRGTGDNNV